MGEFRHWHSFLECGNTVLFLRLGVYFIICMYVISLVINVYLVTCQIVILIAIDVLTIVVCLVRTAHLNNILIHYDSIIIALMIFITP